MLRKLLLLSNPTLYINLNPDFKVRVFYCEKIKKKQIYQLAIISIFVKTIDVKEFIKETIDISIVKAHI